MKKTSTLLTLVIVFTLCTGALHAQQSDEEKVEETRKGLEMGAKEVLTPALARPPYNPRGKRDPFKPFLKLKKVKPKAKLQRFVPPIKKYPLERYQLVGVMWIGNKPRAMVVDPENNTYYLTVGDEIGNLDGRITEIRDNGLRVEEMTTREDVFGVKEDVTKQSILAFAKVKKGRGR